MQQDLFNQPPRAMSATLSDDGRYRYTLERQWGDGKTVAFVMLNPSTADASQDDSTIRHCVNFARLWGCGRLVVVNLFAWRATDPGDLPADKAEAVGPGNDEVILAVARQSDIVVCAWGTHGAKWGRGAEVLAMLRTCTNPHALRMTKDGHPSHPLYLPGNLIPRIIL